MKRRWWLRWWWRDEERGDAHHVSAATLRDALRHEETRGVDLPTWKSPAEIAEMRKAERRAALRLVRKTGTDQ